MRRRWDLLALEQLCERLRLELARAEEVAEHWFQNCQELAAFQTRGGMPEGARVGIAWFNSLTPTQRGHSLAIAGSAVPAEAWRA